MINFTETMLSKFFFRRKELNNFLRESNLDDIKVTIPYAPENHRLYILVNCQNSSSVEDLGELSVFEDQIEIILDREIGCDILSVNTVNEFYENATNEFDKLQASSILDCAIPILKINNGQPLSIQFEEQRYKSLKENFEHSCLWKACQKKSTKEAHSIKQQFVESKEDISYLVDDENNTITHKPGKSGPVK